MWGILFLVQALLFVCLLLVVFKSKNTLKTEENRLFNVLAVEEIVLLIIEILLNFAVIYLGDKNTISFILARLFLIGIYSWFCTFSIYTYYITRAKIIKDEKKRIKIYSIVKKIIYLLIIFGSVLFIVLPIKLMIEGDKKYSYGPAVDVLKVTLGIGLIFWLILLVNNRRNIKTKEFIPIYSVMVLLIVNVIVQTISPEILIASSTVAFNLFIMFFTIENPDLKMIEQLELAKDQADRANRAKTDFLSSMSHEIRTPLNAISGFSDCILESNSLDEAKENAKDIIDASNTLIEIVNGILDVSKIEAGKLDIVCSPYDSRDIFTELAKLITPRMNEKGLDFSYHIAHDLPETLYGDYTNLKKVVTNLLSNACKYTDKGYVRYEVNCINSKDYTKLIISVEDSGRGIKRENIEKMFTKFQRLEEDRNTTIEGTGLGLAITKQLTELMGGKIIVHSIYGKGSKFTVIINQKLTNQEVKEEKSYKTTLDLHDVKILLVDDTQLNLKVESKLLENYNANNITTCDSGFECLDKISSGERYDIILLDDMMPKMSGVSTLKKLKEIPGFNTPTVALTANAITGMKESYLAEGFTDYLAKPIEKNELVRVINQALGRVVTEQIPIINEESNKDNNEDLGEEESNINDIIPVEDNIEEILGEKLDLSDEVDNHFDDALVHVDHIDDVEVLDDTKDIETIPVVDIDLPTETIEKVDVNYLKDNGVDVDHALELLGDMEMYNSTVTDFINDVGDKWNRIVEYKNNSDMENYAIEVHSLKSDSKYLGLMKLADIAYQHELKSKENDIDFVNEHFSELEGEFNSAMSIIKKYSDSIKKD